MPDHGGPPAGGPGPSTGDRRYIHPLRIGDVVLANNLLLAPMAGYTNLAFRLIAKEVGGCGMVASEMVAAIAHPTSAQAARFVALTRSLPAERPISMQVYGRDPQLCAATAAALERAGADVIDLNCGCPVRKARQAGCGVALMREPAQVGRIIAAMRRATTRPVTIKMRLGIDHTQRNAVEVAQAAVDHGASAVCVHARTGESKHGAPVDLSGLAAVRAALPPDIPVIANGSLDTPDAIRRAKDEAGADGYMIGRAACGNPWIFRNLIAALAGTPPYQPTLAERRALLERHFELILDLYGEERGVRIMRKYAFLYCNGLPGVRRFRAEFCRIASRSDFASVTERFFAALERRDIHGPEEELTVMAHEDEDDDRLL